MPMGKNFETCACFVAQYLRLDDLLRLAGGHQVGVRLKLDHRLLDPPH